MMNSPHWGAAVVARGRTDQPTAAQTTNCKTLERIFMHSCIAPHLKRGNRSGNLPGNAAGL